MNLLKIFFFIFSLFTTTVGNRVFGQNSDSLKPAVYYFENGKVSSEGTLRNGKPDGYWKSYHRNGNIKTEGNRNNYLLDGTWKFYSEQGELYLTIDYKEDKKDGYRNSYRGDQVYKREKFLNDQREGLTEEFYANGKVKSVTPYEEGREKGLGFDYDTAGTIITLKTFKAGVLVKEQRINRYDELNKKAGMWMQFYADRQVKNEGLYVNDLKHGYWKYYKADGNLIRVEKWVNGVLIEDANEVAKIDIRREIDPQTGKIKSIGGYKNGKKEGVHREYDNEGNVINSTVYSNDIVLAEGIYDEEGRRQGLWKFYVDAGTGELKETGKYKNNLRVGTWKYYFIDGEIEQIGDFANDKPEGTWRWYYPNKQLRLEENYEDGFEEGPSVEFDESGNEVAKGNYVEGFKDGLWTYHIGNIKETGKYYEGEKQGLWVKKYIDNGNIAFEGEYLNGQENGMHKEYHANGQPKRRGRYSLGVRDGLWEYLDENGNIILTIKYDRGKEIEYNGEKISYGKRVDRELEEEEQAADIQQ
jgi:antitoxin component YwqK of YwqJK toxin-antitoxin module